MSGISADAIERELDRIRSLDLKELRREWVRLYHSPAPRISRDLLVLGLAYRVQETEYGGLGKSIRRKLQTIAKALRTTGRRRDSSLLTGSVFDDSGQRLTPTYAIKKGTRYRYYVSASLITRGRSGSSGLRIPAGD